MSASGTAFADERSDIFGGGAGPVFAWGTQGFTAGWEVSATLGSPLLRLALGGDYLRGTTLVSSQEHATDRNPASHSFKSSQR